MKVYISGQITSLTQDKYRKAFNRATIDLGESGHEPVDPSLLGKPEQYSWHYYMKKAIPQLCECDAIYMLRGWEKSKGARLEQVIAQGLDMNTFYEEDGEFNKEILNE